MRRGITITILIFIAIVFFGALYYLYNKNQQSPIVFETDKPETKTNRSQVRCKTYECNRIAGEVPRFL